MNSNFENKVILVSRSPRKLLPLIDLTITNNNDDISIDVKRAESPYEQIYMPEIIDYYPRSLDVSASIGMFCFPTGVAIKKQMEMPTWFSFVLTDESFRRTYGSCLIITEEMSNDFIHAFIPKYITDKKLYVDKAICLLTYEPFFSNCQIFLRELYRIQVSNGTTIPLERAICHFVDSIYILNFEKFISFTIAEEEIKFYKIPIYGEEWDTNNIYITTIIKINASETPKIPKIK